MDEWKVAGVIAIILLLLLIGCTKEVIKYEIIEIVKPVAIDCKQPPEIIKPRLLIFQFQSPNNNDNFACMNKKHSKNFLEYLISNKYYTEQLNTIIDSYKDKSEENK